MELLPKELMLMDVIRNLSLRFRDNFQRGAHISFEIRSRIRNTKSTKGVIFTNRCTYLLVLESIEIYIKIHAKMLLHVSVCDHHQGARTWAWPGQAQVRAP